MNTRIMIFFFKSLIQFTSLIQQKVTTECMMVTR